VRRLALFFLAGAVCTAASLPPAPASADVAVIVIDGRGFGHGVGMAQDGAERMGRLGANTNQILGQFYPGTALARTSGRVRVVVAGDPHGDAALSFPTGGEVRDAPGGPQSPGFPVTVAPGGAVHVHFDGTTYTVSGPNATAARAAPSLVASRAVAPLALLGPDPTATSTATTTTTTTTLLPAPPTLAPPTTSAPPSTQPTPTVRPTSTTTTSTTTPPGAPAPGAPGTAPTASSTRPLWAVPTGANGAVAVGDGSHRYRGMTEAEGLAPAPPGGATLQLVNQLDVEQYLRGMGEVLDPKWPPASLRVQAVAARTYALRAMAAGGEICADDRCQVYLGQQVEYPAMDKAVSETAGQVLMFARALASTVYSANGGGVSATREEGFGASEAGSDAAYPYLRAAPYPTGDPMPWSVTVGVGDVATRLGYPGQLTGVKVSKAGPSGRALELTLDGSAGPRQLAGVSFARTLGLRSTLFTTRLGSATAAPPPPPPGQESQAPPDQAAAIAAASALALPSAAGGTAGQRPGRVHRRGGGGVSLPLWPGLAVVGALALAAVVAQVTGWPPQLLARSLWQRLRRAEP